MLQNLNPYTVDPSDRGSLQNFWALTAELLSNMLINGVVCRSHLDAIGSLKTE